MNTAVAKKNPRGWMWFDLVRATGKRKVHRQKWNRTWKYYLNRVDRVQECLAPGKPQNGFGANAFSDDSVGEIPSNTQNEEYRPPISDRQ